MSYLSKTRKRPVTIAIGFVFKARLEEGEAKVLMLGSDSRISKGSTVADDETKIVEIPCGTSSVLVAKAGFKVTTDNFEELFRKELEGATVVDYRTIPNLAQKAMAAVRTALLCGGGLDSTKQLDDHYCECVIGFFHAGTPYLYSIDLRASLANRCNKDFLGIGDGATLADFLLSSVNMEGLDVYQACEMAVAVIEMCKLHNSSCGGPCLLAAITELEPGRAKLANDIILDATKALKSRKEIHKYILKRFGEDFAGSDEPKTSAP